MDVPMAEAGQPGQEISVSASPKNDACLSYRFVALDKSSRQIRLLSISGMAIDNDQKIPLLHLELFDLENRPQFAALSYEWGSDINMQRVLVDGFSLKIRSNLHDFLVAYVESPLAHDKDVPYLFWIDQICINQQAVDERNHQVSLMHQIYSNARLVIVWLGNYSQAHIAFGAIRHMMSKSGQKQIDHFCHSRLHTHNAIIDCMFEKQCLDELGKLYKASYWGRHWIIQELALAKHCVVLYGNDHVPLGELIKCEMYTWGSPALRCEHTRWLFRIVDSKTRDVQHWTNAMLLAGRTSCQDARDKVFGIQSFFDPDWRIPINYDQSVRDVFLEAATKYWVLLLTGIKGKELAAGLANLAFGMGLTAHVHHKQEELETLLTSAEHSVESFVQVSSQTQRLVWARELSGDNIISRKKLLEYLES